jgi:hypothetical protein
MRGLKKIWTPRWLGLFGSLLKGPVSHLASQAFSSQAMDMQPVIHPVRLGLLALISQPFSSVFILQQISISQNQPTKNLPANRVNIVWLL